MPTRLQIIQCLAHHPVPLDNGEAPEPTCYLHHDGTWHCVHCHRGGFWEAGGDERYLLRVADTMPAKVVDVLVRETR
jgi:hypothetical protein